jgi:protein-S-isoprenylcysteine O-methyltransferase Ste14
MSSTTVAPPSSATPARTRALVRRRMVQLGASLVVQAAALFAGSGRVGWTMAWVYLVSYVAMIAFTRLLVHDPELFAERAQMGKGAKRWDKAVSVVYGISGLAVLVVAALDARFVLSPLPRAASAAGLALFAAGFALSSWAMASNRFFSTFVRIQTDRGHTVATGGPYRVVRHPGYVGFTAATLGTALLLGSGWALVPAALTGLVIAVRTALEDRTLLAELPGYREYAARVRYRLLPGLW